MNINDLTPGTGNVTLEAEVAGVGEVREINKMGRQLRVCDITIKDDSGTMTLVLWNDNIDKVKEGDLIQLENAYVNEWQNKAQLTLGKFGKLEVKS